MLQCAAALALLGVQCFLTEASLAEGWGAPPRMMEAPVGTPPAALVQESEQGGDSEVITMTGDGAFHKASTMVRRHQADSEHHHHHHHHDSVESMFHAIDSNGVGLVSPAELKADARRLEEHGPHPHPMIGSDSSDAEGGISFAQFKAAAQHAVKDFALQHHGHHASIHNHQNAGKEELLEKAHLTTKTLVTTVPSWVTCGGHKAPTCSACTTTNSGGQTVFDHGAEWCHGDCVYQNKVCYLLGSAPVTISNTVAGQSKGYATTPVPDLLNPNITKKDVTAVNDAATAGIKEENVEAARKQREEEEAIEKRKFSWGKFWLIVIIAFSVILGCCAVVSIIALVVFCCMANPGPPPGKDDDEAEDVALAGEGEGEGVADAVADAPVDDAVADAPVDDSAP